MADADEPCPACGERGWDELRPLDESRGTQSTPGGGWEPTAIVVCRACGHEESVGGFYGIPVAVGLEEDEAEAARWRTERQLGDFDQATFGRGYGE